MKDFFYNLWKNSTPLDWFTIGIVIGSLVVGSLLAGQCSARWNTKRRIGHSRALGGLSQIFVCCIQYVQFLVVVTALVTGRTQKIALCQFLFHFFNCSMSMWLDCAASASACRFSVTLFQMVKFQYSWNSLPSTVDALTLPSNGLISFLYLIDSAGSLLFHKNFLWSLSLSGFFK